VSTVEANLVRTGKKSAKTSGAVPPKNSCHKANQRGRLRQPKLRTLGGPAALPNRIDQSGPCNLVAFQMEIKPKPEGLGDFRRSFSFICSSDILRMPLVVFSGLPSSGKTTRALQLQKALDIKMASSPRKFRIHVINDDVLGINREVYRGALFSPHN
jgi:hypothetical protein